MNSDIEADLIRDIKILSERAWERRVDVPAIEAWLGNFTGIAFDPEVERLHALHLLRHFVYFGSREMRVLLEALYRDVFKYPIVQDIRASLQGTSDAADVSVAYDRELGNTRFVAMGNPSESGSHLMYYFRQVNRLPKDLFVSVHQLVNGPMTSRRSRFTPPSLERIVFLDDLLGSGQQVTAYSKTMLRDLRKIETRRKHKIHISYLTLFAKSGGLDVARRSAFDDVRALHELDDSQMAFSRQSRVYHRCGPHTNMQDAQILATAYGSRLLPGDALGYGNGQMLMGFQHNVPDNTLPIFWFDEAASNWEPIFPRFQKVY